MLRAAWHQYSSPCLLLLFSILFISCRNGQDVDQDRTTARNGRGGKLPVFTDVTIEAGLGDFRHENGAVGKMWFPEQMGAGGGFVDFDGDGWLDILLVGGGLLQQDKARSIPALRLYKNNGNGFFSEVTAAVGLDDIQAYGTGIAAADYDGDGDEDFYFTTIGENMLFRNDGGVFSSIGKEAGVANQVVWSSSSLFFDPDCDGDLDLYVGNYAKWSLETDVVCSIEGGVKVYCRPARYEGLPSRFYGNNGDGTFTDLTEEAGFLPAPGKSLGVAEFDFNRDGWPDFVVANDGEGDLLYQNKGDGTFREIGMISGMGYGENGEARAGMGIDVGVVDDTGQESVFVGNFSYEMIGVYRYIENGLFMNRDAVSKIGRPSFLSLTFGLFLFDVEYDGDLDLLAANGHVYPVRTQYQDGSSYRQPAQLFVNRGDGTFYEASPLIGGVFAEKMVARAAAYADYDRDGDLDILFTENGGPVHLWRNELSDANYLRVRLEGKASNREGLGSQLIAVVDGKRMYRRMRTGSSYLSQSEKIVSFGLGCSTRVDSLLVQWPSGQLDIFVALKGNQELKIIEGSDQYEVMVPD